MTSHVVHTMFVATCCFSGLSSVSLVNDSFCSFSFGMKSVFVSMVSLDYEACSGRVR